MMEPTYILIPGAGGSGYYWNLVVAELERRGHNGVAVDLPPADPKAGLSDYVDAVLSAVGSATDVILVGQSLGGFTAVEACPRLPVSLLVFVNAMIPIAGESPGEWWAATGQEEAMRKNDLRQGRSAEDGFDLETYFLHDLPQPVIDELGKRPNEQSEGIFASRLSLKSLPPVPTRAIAARDDRFFPIDFQRLVSQQRLGVPVDEVAGGHLVALSQPVAVVDLLENYLVSA